MIDYIDEMYRDLARDLSRSHELYPSESIDYKIMMQDLSEGLGGTIVPDIEYTDASIVQLRGILHTMPADHLRFFFHYYVSRGSRIEKMEAVGVKTKGEFFGLRDKLHSYTQYRLDFDSAVDLKALTKDRLTYPTEKEVEKVVASA